jgi:hypothetical protein
VIAVIAVRAKMGDANVSKTSVEKKGWIRLRLSMEEWGCGAVLMGNWSRVKPKTCVRQPNRVETQHRNREQKDRQDKDKARREDNKLEER